VNTLKNLFASDIFSSRYRTIVLSIALFIVFDLSILLMNFYISAQLTKDAGIVNLAAEMRMMSQRMVKSLYEIDQAIETEGDTQTPLDELKQSYQSFNENLIIFQTGGMVSNLNGESFKIEQPKDQEAIDTLKGIENLWLPFKNILSPIVGVAKIDGNNAYMASALSDAISYGSANNLSFLKLSTQLGERIEVLTADKVNQLKLVQISGMSFALINFIVILFHFIGRLRNNDSELEEALKQNEQILETVQEGLLLIDKDGIISGQYSTFLEQLFIDETIAGASFFDLLRTRVTASDLQVAEKYIRLLFKEKVKDLLTTDLNPLKRVELHKVLKDGRYEKTILSLNFSQVLAVNGSVKYLLVTMKNISELISLENALQVAKSETDEQLQIIKTILRSDPKESSSYLGRAINTLNNVNNILENSSRDETSYRKKIGDIYIDIHRLKGDSSINNMSEIASACHQMEAQLQHLKNKSDLKGEDFMGFTIQLKDLLQKVEAYQLVSKQLSEFGKKNGSTNENKICSPEKLLELVGRIAHENGKKVELIYSEIATDQLPDETKTLVADLIVQLLRNAVVHGIETVKQRKLMGKQEQGKIVVNILHKEGELTISVRDDGSGIDFPKLKQKAQQSGEWEAEDLEKLKGKDLAKLLFVSGLSSRDEVDEHSGRGIGMNVIKENIHKLNGKIAVATTPLRATSFQIKIPTNIQTDLDRSFAVQFDAKISSKIENKKEKQQSILPELSIATQ